MGSGTARKGDRHREEDQGQGSKEQGSDPSPHPCHCFSHHTVRDKGEFKMVVMLHLFLLPLARWG